MSSDLAARLRALAQDYGEGKLSLATYRKLRAPLIDSLELQGTIRSDDDEITRPRVVPRPADAAASAEPEAPKSKRGLIVTIAVLGVALAAGAGVWLSRSGGGDEVSSTAENAPPPDAVAALVHSFQEGGDWSEAHIASFDAALRSLGPQRIARASTEPAFRQFVEDVRRRFKEQQALAAAPLTRESSSLAALAVTVGLDLNSPDSAIHIAPPEPPPAPAPAPAAHAHADVPHPAPAVAPKSEARSEPAAPARTASVPKAVPVPAETPKESTHATVPTDDPCKVTLVGSRRPVCHDTLPGGEAGPELALVPPGTFEMGSTAAAEEQPVHRVSLERPFAISIYEISQAEFKLFCERTRASCAAQPWSGDDYPVVNVSWNEARAYTEWLSSATHRRYRLPTEGEWEYAARAGQTGPFPSGDVLSPTDAWFSHGERAETPARRSQRFNANRFRLLHTVGNVREWVQESWSEGFKAAPAAGVRVVRGGSRAEGGARLRLSMREGLPEGTRDVLTGFRVVRDLQ